MPTPEERDNPRFKPFEHEERFHELLCKTLKGEASEEEQLEYNRLEKLRSDEVDAFEAPMVAKLDEEIKKLREALTLLENANKQHP